MNDMEGLIPLIQSPGNTSYKLFCTIPVFYVQEWWIQDEVVAEMGYSTGLGNGEPGVWEENGRLWSSLSRVWGPISWWTINIWREKITI